MRLTAGVFDGGREDDLIDVRSFFRLVLFVEVGREGLERDATGRYVFTNVQVSRVQYPPDHRRVAAVVSSVPLLEYVQHFHFRSNAVKQQSINPHQ